MKKRLSKNIEWIILIATVLLSIIGLFAIYSATASTKHEEFYKQLMWLGISIPVMIALIIADYDQLAKAVPVLYGISLLSLVAVLFTKPIGGATSWFVIGSISVQPSEFSKIIFIITIALLIAKIKKNNENDINKPLKLMQVLAVAAIPLLLILKQPDYGTGSAFVFALLCMLFTAGISKKYIITGTLLVVIIIPLLYFFVLPPHAKQRIQVFLNPAVDPRGSGYNLTQSKIAIGAGQLTGMGYLKGNQTQLGFLYPKSTDFIFSVIGEELGFVVAGSIIILYVVLITKSISIAKTARDELGSLIASGITGIFFFHMIENIGMTIGMLPITGVPLPFVSYGGSSLLSNFVMIALLLNISGRRQKNIFSFRTNGRLYRPAISYYL